MALTLSTPIQTSATFDSIWMSSIHISSPLVNGEANARIILTPYSFATGISDPSNAIHLPVNNIMARIAAGDTALAQILGSIETWVQAEYARQQSATAQQSTISSNISTVSANGSAQATITVTLNNINNMPMAGKTVTLTSSRGADDSIVAVNSVTGANGQAVFTVSSSVAGSSIFTAVDSTDSVTVSQVLVVSFN